ncbi:MAG: lipid A export permease/ATP-binding protein MsbA [Burkholderiales bacterium]|nr:lipid A export permease/ATP-binding protein MsbA [Burkholderiales bacterium]
MAESDTRRPSFYRDPVFRRLFAKVLAHKRLLLLSIVGMAITAAIDPTMARLTGVMLDKGFYERDAGAVLWLPFAFVGLFFLRGLSTFASALLLNRVSQAVLVDLRASMFERLLHWPQAQIEGTPSGLVVSKFLNEASNALNLAAEVMTTAVRDTLTVIALLTVLLYYNWQLTLVTLLIAPLIALVLRSFSARLRRLNLENQAMLGEMTRAVQEAHEGSRVIKVYDGFDYEQGRFARINAKLRRFAMKMQAAWSAGTPLTQLIAAIGLSVVITAAMWQARAGQLSPGEFVTFLAAAMLLLPALRGLAGLNGPLARMLAAGESVFALIDSAAEEDRGARTIERARGRIEFAGVSFAYPGAAGAAVEQVDLAVEPGEMIALVGPSGAGKTTLINLIPRFIRPTAGRILLDGIDIQELRLADLRRQVALVSQDVVMFDDTIAANIAYGGCRGASAEAIRTAADAAYLLPFIESLPQGFDTRIGENAVKLSGGQRQRLSIARALLKNAPILLLDEATSALDSESERFIQASLDRLMHGRTTFVVAHRLSTIEAASRIVVLEAGRIVEVGRHAELLAAGGLYSHLHRIQFSATAKETTT